MKKNSVKINILIILLTGLFSLAPTCQSGITQSTTYPIELFSEMHYSPAYKSQETPRLKPVAEAVVNLDPIGIGFTVKYLKGLLYYSLDPIQDSYIQTTETEIRAYNKTGTDQPTNENPNKHESKCRQK